MLSKNSVQFGAFNLGMVSVSPAPRSERSVIVNIDPLNTWFVQYGVLDLLPYQ
jgi:hypothetical protein